jgi:hypothetical protein
VFPFFSHEDVPKSGYHDDTFFYFGKPGRNGTIDNGFNGIVEYDIRPHRLENPIETEDQQHIEKWIQSPSIHCHFYVFDTVFAERG